MSYGAEQGQGTAPLGGEHDQSQDPQIAVPGSDGELSYANTNAPVPTGGDDWSDQGPTSEQQGQDQEQHQGGEDMGGVGPPRSVADELNAKLGVATKPPIPSKPAGGLGKGKEESDATGAETGGTDGVTEVTPQQTNEPEEEEPKTADDPFAASSNNAWGASLFDDASGAPEDIFATSKDTGSMFSTEDIFSDAATGGSGAPVDIFGADDIFSMPTPTPVAKPAAAKEASPVSAPEVASASASTTSVLEDDLFGPPKPAVGKPAVSGNSIFGDGYDDDIFAPKKTPTISAPTSEASQSEAGTNAEPAAIASESPSAAVRKPPAGAVSLFGGVDMFGGKSPSRSRSSSNAGPPVASPTAADSVLPPVEDDAAAVPAESTLTPAAAGRKPPAGAVSLFGGVDMFSGSSPSNPSETRSRSSSQSKRSSSRSNSRATTPSNTSPPAVAPAAASGGFFDDDSGSFAPNSKPAAAIATKTSLFGADDDLFGSPKSSDLFGSPKKAPAMSIPSGPSGRGTKTTGSLFGDDDGFSSLFGTPPSSSSVKKPVASKAIDAPIDGLADPKKSEAESESEVSPPGGKKKVFGGVSMFGPGSSDMFGSSATSNRPPPPRKTPQVIAEDVSPSVAANSLKEEPKKALAPSLFGDDDDSLFAPSKPAAKTSLFGDEPPGGDLFSIKPKAVVKTAPLVASVAPPTKSSPVASSPLVSSTSNPLSSGSPKRGKIAALGAGINFNPAMLLGGGRPAPPKAAAVEAHLTESGELVIENSKGPIVDEASQGAKSRATLRRRGGRRAPTRRKARHVDEWDDDDDDDDNDNVEENKATSSLPPTPDSTLVAASETSTTATASESFASGAFGAAAAVGSMDALSSDNVEDIFGGSDASADIFGASAAPLSGSVPDIFGDAPDIF